MIHRKTTPPLYGWLLVLTLLSGSVVVAQSGASGGDWQSYAADRASSKYSPLDQIDADNVDQLEIVWRWKSVDYEAAETVSGLRVSNMFETTPVAIDGVLYLSTGLGIAAAIDGATGETRWVWSPYDGGGEPDRANLGLGINRGLGSWIGDGDPRVLFVSNGYLLSVDAASGKPNLSFGTEGRVDMRDLGADREPLRSYQWTSPPTVCGDVVVMGNSTRDPYNFKKGLPGLVRGYDVHTGKLLWIFDIVPREGELGRDTWLDGSAEETGHANVWTWMSCDEELGYVYAPTSTPTDDWYGGHRPGDGLFGESIVALNAKTGERVWHFQAVHHGLWDYDFPSAPVLADIVVDGRPVKAIAQPSKQAILYVLDRVTGEPVWPIEEVAVPASDVPGERAAPTQPMPTKPPPYDLHGLRIDDLIDFTPELRAEAIEILEQYRYGPIFLPPSLAEGSADGKRGAIQSPGPVGGSDWNGVGLDPETGILYIPSVTAPLIAAVGPPPGRGDVDYMTRSGGFLAGPGGLPITKPPWGRLTAMDLNEGEILWVVPNGEGPRDHPRLQGLDLPPLGQTGRGSPLVTKTLVFLPEGSPDMIAVPPGGGGRMLRAFDKTTGEVVWAKELPAGATGAPMTYLAAGRQFIVVPVGERQHEGEYVALALPSGP